MAEKGLSLERTHRSLVKRDKKKATVKGKDEDVEEREMEGRERERERERCSRSGGK